MKRLVGIASAIVLLIGLHEWAAGQPANTQPSKISQFPAAGTLNGTELFPCDQTNGGVLGTYQCTVQQVANFIGVISSITSGQITTALGYTPANKAGDTFTGKVTTLASAAGGAGLNLPPGAAPSSPSNGDVWVTSASIFARIAGATKDLLATISTASGDCSGTVSGGNLPLTCSSLLHLANAETVTGQKTFNGGVALNYPVYNSNTTLSIGAAIVCGDVSGGAVTLTLPPGTGTAIANGTTLTIKDCSRSSATHNLLICPNSGQTLEGSASCLTVSTNGQSVNSVWRNVAAGGASNNWDIM